MLRTWRKKTYEEPGQRGSSANFLLALSTKESCGLVRVEKEKKAKENSPSHDKYLSLSPSPKGVGTMAIMEVDEGKKKYDEPGQCGSSANSPPAPSDKGSGGFTGGGNKKHENYNTSSHDKYAFPSFSLKMLAGIELDLDAYMNDPASCQLSKKALCADQMSLVTAA
jgi:hypothetical protein